jgi:hypothetical protein
MRRIRRWIGAAAAFLMIWTAVGAGASVLTETEKYLTGDGESAVGILIEGKIIKMPQFAEERTEKLNRILQHAGIRIEISGEESRAVVTMDGEDIFSLTGDGGEGAGTEAIRRYGRIWKSLEKWKAFFAALPEAFPETRQESKINTPYKEYGKAVKRTALTLSAEEAAEQAAKAGTGTGLYPEAGEMQFEGKQKIALQTGEEGQLIRINYNGKCGLSDGSIRNVSVEWKTVTEENRSKDQIQIRTPAATGGERDNLQMTREWTLGEDGKEILTWTAETDALHNRIRTQKRMTARTEAAEGKMTIDLAEATVESGETRRTEITGEISLEEGKPAEGMLAIILKTGKIETEHYEVSFRTYPVIPAIPGDAAETAGGEKSESEIRREQSAALVRAILKLPEEDQAFLKDGIGEDLWKEILP